ncbi:MAG: dienelactone hydrolase family protein [Pirellula sp.]|jgi:pimeloyl-ACP methyl ester carboxylesterase|nr:dienelactone hydrolase family protein [Pirellula sp.]
MPGFFLALALTLCGGLGWGSNVYAYQAALSREESDEQIKTLWKEKVAALKETLEKELAANEIELDGKKLKLLVKEFGSAPEGERSLYISMHGGGNAPPRVNDQQWKNQIRLYEPEEGIYVAPRAPSDTWNLWHEAHIDGLFDRLILAHVVCRGVNPNKVYLMGYSAGGDGVYQLAPRTSDRWAAVAMMAGHPNETRPEGLRNVPFALFMGEKDSAFNRNQIAKDWKTKLEMLAASDEGGYDHWVKTYDTGHWMNGQDRECLPWLKERQRNPWPKKIVWVQDDVKHSRSYWLGVDPDQSGDRTEIRGRVEGQKITIESTNATSLKQLRLYLHDELLDLNSPVSVVWDDAVVFEGKVPRTQEAIARSLAERMDVALAAPVLLEITRP